MKKGDTLHPAKRILIVGCGELGSRHLQAVATLPEVAEIEVVDPRPEGLQLGRERVAEVEERKPSIDYRWLSSIEEAHKGGDLCIVATQADVRCEVVRRVAESLGYNSFLLEKMVAQSVRDYEGLMEFSREKGLSVWVNCKTRAYPFHKRLKSLLDPREPLVLVDVGGNHGLANNGIHVADLFVFYDETDSIKSGGCCVDPVLHPSKRGNGLFELSGLLQGYTQKGSRLTILFARDHVAPDHLSIASSRYRCVVDHMSRWAWESDASTGWEWRPIPFEGNLLVSSMTKQFAADILSSGTCELPNLKECFPAHRFILTELRPHFSKLLKTEVERLPVT